MAAWVTLRHRWTDARAIAGRPGTVARLAGSAVLIALNWLLYIWAVVHDHVVEASLGYFINPLVNVLLGVLVLRERLSRGAVAGRGGPRRGGSGRPHREARPPALDRARARDHVRPLRPRAQDRRGRRGRGAPLGDGRYWRLSRRRVARVPRGPGTRGLRRFAPGRLRRSSSSAAWRDRRAARALRARRPLASALDARSSTSRRASSSSWPSWSSARPSRRARGDVRVHLGRALHPDLGPAPKAPARAGGGGRRQPRIGRESGASE